MIKKVSIVIASILAMTLMSPAYANLPSGTVIFNDINHPVPVIPDVVKDGATSLVAEWTDPA